MHKKYVCRFATCCYFNTLEIFAVLKFDILDALCMLTQISASTRTNFLKTNIPRTALISHLLFENQTKF